MKKIFLLLVGIVAALLCLSGCSPINRVLNEKQLHEMLVKQFPQSVVRRVEGMDLTFAVDKCKIVRRQTNKDDKKDMVDLKLSVYTNDYEGEFYYTLDLDYYDEGGWQLDTYDINADDVLEAKGNTVPKKLIEDKMNKLKAAYGKCELISENFDSETGTLYHIYNVDCDSKYLKATGDITVEYKLELDRDNFSWWGQEKSGVAQEWKLAQQYNLDIGNDSGITTGRTALNTIPSVFVEGNKNKGKREGINSLYIHEITNDEIILSAYVITYAYEDGYVEDKSAEWRDFTLDLSVSQREVQVCYNLDTRDNLTIKLDCENGFSLLKNKYELAMFKPMA